MLMVIGLVDLVISKKDQGKKVHGKKNNLKKFKIYLLKKILLSNYYYLLITGNNRLPESLS